MWGADISPEDTPFEAGLGFAVKLDKGDFVGRDALVGVGEPERTLALPDAGRPARGRARLGAGPCRRRARRARHERRLRLHGRRLDRVRVPAVRARRRHRGRGGDLRRVGRRRGRRRAALRPRRGEDPRVTTSAAAVARVWPDGASAGGARRRHHEPQRQGRRAPTAWSCCASRGRTPTCSGSTARSSSQQRARRRGRRRPRGRRLRRARGLARDAVRRGSSPSLERMREPETLQARRRGAAGVHDRPADPGPLRRLPRRRDLPRTALGRGATLPGRVRVGARSSPAGSPGESAQDVGGPCHNDLLNANFMDDGERLRDRRLGVRGHGRTASSTSRTSRSTTSSTRTQPGRAARGVLR